MNKSVITTSIFYSWQSDLDKKYNRYAIEASLKEAQKRLKAESICVDIDQATRGEVGTPDIVETILKKITQSEVFVCDVTYINHDCKCLRGDSTLRRTPNPNVLFELGYALRILGWERVLIILNTDYGKIDDLPFDLNKRLVLSYSCNETNKRESIQKLSGDLKSRIIAIIEKNPTKPILIGEVSIEKVRRDRDISTLNDVLSTLHIPTLLNFIHEDAPKYRSHLLINMYNIFEGSLKLNIVHFYDDLLGEKFMHVVRALDESLAYGECFDDVPNSDRYIFRIPGDVFRTDEEEKKYLSLDNSRIKLYRVLTDFIKYLKDRYIEVDIVKTNKSAFELLRSCMDAG